MTKLNLETVVLNVVRVACDNVTGLRMVSRGRERYATCCACACALTTTTPSTAASISVRIVT